MLHRCTVGSCSCCHGDGFTTSQHFPLAANAHFSSFLLSAPGSHNKQTIPSFDEPNDHHHSHYSSPVDCTLSLGTPSTRSSSGFDTERRSSSASGSCMPNFCWDLLQPPKHYSSSVANSNSNGGSGSNNGCGSGNDSLLARRCVNCDTTSTPLWRNGPRGPKSLCNACGIRFKKEERRAGRQQQEVVQAGSHHPLPLTRSTPTAHGSTPTPPPNHIRWRPPASSRQQSVTSSSSPMTMEGPAKSQRYHFSRGALMWRTDGALCTTSQDEFFEMISMINQT